MKNLKDLVRPNVWNMKPYSSARDEFQGNASVSWMQTKTRLTDRTTAIPILCNGN